MSLSKLTFDLSVCVPVLRICEAAKTNGLLEQELAHAVNASSHAINKTHPKFPEVRERPAHTHNTHPP